MKLLIFLNNNGRGFTIHSSYIYTLEEFMNLEEVPSHVGGWWTSACIANSNGGGLISLKTLKADAQVELFKGYEDKKMFELLKEKGIIKRKKQ